MGDLGKINVATGFEKLAKVQYIAQSGHNGTDTGGSFFKVLFVLSKAFCNVTRYLYDMTEDVFSELVSARFPSRVYEYFDVWRGGDLFTTFKIVGV